MAQLDYMEKRGSGLKRICKETAKLDSYTEARKPVFKSSSSQFMTTIFSVEYNGELNGELNNTQKATLNYIKQQPGSKAIEISSALRIPFSTIEKHIRLLQSKGIIERRGSKKTGGYYVVKK